MNLEGITNLYEHLVAEQIVRLMVQQARSLTDDDAEDVACIALNILPARYVRHSVDTAFYMEEAERASMLKAVVEAVDKAIARVSAHPGAAD